ncbi:MAG TPA: TatD family hydrolase [Flavobacterium lutivivi]|nr:TatD family hydrolase [Flavobacterium lutivivi]
MLFYNLHTHHSVNNDSIVELVNQYPWEFKESVKTFSIGIHPWHIDEKRIESDLKIIDEKLHLDNCLALGECGLDKRIEIDIELQKLVFEKQIALAEKHQKPLVLHLVAAFQELIEIKNKWNITVPIVIHGFSKSEQLAKQLIDNGFYLSFGKYLLRNPELETVFKSIPEDRYLLETDMIEETIEQVYSKAAGCKNTTLEKIQQQVEKNWKTIFSK